MRKKMPLVSIITPIYNEKDFILKTIEKLENLSLPGLRKEIILIDNYSTDGGRKILREIKNNKKYKNKYKIIFHQKNKGLGGSLKSGFKAAQGDYVVRQDVDLEYDVNEIHYLLYPLLHDKADIVYGSRTLNKNNKYSKKTYFLGGIALNLFFNFLYLNRISDFITAAKAFKKEVVKNMKLEEKGFEIESEISAKALKKGYRIISLPISYYPRTFEQGKKIRWHHAFKILKALIKYRFS